MMCDDCELETGTDGNHATDGDCMRAVIVEIEKLREQLAIVQKMNDDNVKMRVVYLTEKQKAELRNSELLEVVRLCAKWVGKVPRLSDEYLEERVAITRAMEVLSGHFTDKQECSACYGTGNVTEGGLNVACRACGGKQKSVADAVKLVDGWAKQDAENCEQCGGGPCDGPKPE